jgi:hypothetical protein
VLRSWGICLDNFPSPSYFVVDNTVLLKWMEIPAVQLFVQHWRKVAFPTVELNGKELRITTAMSFGRKSK